MESTVKFVPPGGHRACLGCSAAKAKCVYPEDSTGGPDLSLVGSIHGGGGGGGKPEAGDSSSVQGVPAPTPCERCDRLGRDCILPVRPRKKRRVGPVRSEINRASTSDVLLSIRRDDNSSQASSCGTNSTAGVTTTTNSAFLETIWSAGYTSATALSPHHPPRRPTAASVESGGASTYAHSHANTSTNANANASAGAHVYANFHANLNASVNADTEKFKSIIHACLQMRPADAERQLRFYRDGFCTFHHLLRFTAHNVKAVELQAKQPSVWLAIVFITSYHDFDYQMRLGRGIIHYFSEQLLYYGNRSLEMLQGLLIFINWYPALNPVVPFCTTLMHMAMSLITDLGLDRMQVSSMPSEEEEEEDDDAKDADLQGNKGRGSRDMEWPPQAEHTGMVSQDFRQATEVTARPKRPKRHIRSNTSGEFDERSVLVGLFCMSNALSADITQSTPLQYTLQLEEACRLLETRCRDRDSPRLSQPPAIEDVDNGVAVSVRTYYLIRRVMQERQEMEVRGVHAMAPLATRTRSFLNELKQMYSRLSYETRTNVHIKVLYHTAEIHIFKMGVNMSSRSDEQSLPLSFYSLFAPESTDEKAGSAAPSTAAVEHECRIRCYQALGSFYKEFFSIPASSYYQLPIASFTHLIFANVTLAMLTAYFCGNTENMPGISPDVQLPTFDSVMEVLADKLQMAQGCQHPLGFVVRNNVFSTFATRFRSFAAQFRSFRQMGPGQRRMSPGQGKKRSGREEEATTGARPTDNASEKKAEQAEWWQWYQEFKAAMMGRGDGSASVSIHNNSLAEHPGFGGASSVYGSVSGSSPGAPGASGVPGPISGPSTSMASMSASVQAPSAPVMTSASDPSRPGTMSSSKPPQTPRRGPSSVASIDSILNPTEMLPDYHTFL